KLKGYEEYLRRRNALTDIKILVDTAIAVLLPARFHTPSLDEIAEGTKVVGESSATTTSSRTDRLTKPGSWRLRPSRLFIRQAQYALDLLVLALSFLLAYLLRFDFAIPVQEFRSGIIQLPCVVAIQFGVLILTGIYSFVWRYIGMAELRTFLRAAFLACLPVVFARLALPMEFKRFQ